MIRVTIEMVPGGFERRKYPMHVIEISNNVLSTLQNRNYGDYDVRVSRKIGKGGKITWWREGTVTRFPRAQKNSVHFLYAALKEVIESGRK